MGSASTPASSMNSHRSERRKRALPMISRPKLFAAADELHQSAGAVGEGDHLVAEDLQQRASGTLFGDAFLFGHRRRQLRQPTDAGRQAGEIDFELPAVGVIDEAEDEGEQSAVPIPQPRGVEGDPTESSLGFDLLLESVEIRNPAVQRPIATEPKADRIRAGRRGTQVCRLRYPVGCRSLCHSSFPFSRCAAPPGQTRSSRRSFLSRARRNGDARRSTRSYQNFQLRVALKKWISLVE